jgi:hypothetical protein
MISKSFKTLRLVINEVSPIGNTFNSRTSFMRFAYRAVGLTRAFLIQECSDMMSNTVLNARIATVDQFMMCVILPPPKQPLARSPLRGQA